MITRNSSPSQPLLNTILVKILLGDFLCNNQHCAREFLNSLQLISNIKTNLLRVISFLKPYISRIRVVVISSPRTLLKQRGVKNPVQPLFSELKYYVMF